MLLIKRLFTASLLLCLLLPSLSHAHGIWFAQRSSQLALIYGVGADDLDSVKRLHKVESIQGFDADWEEVDTELMQAGPLLLVNSDDYPVAAAAVMFNGIWSYTKDGHWVAKGRDEIPDAVLSEKTYKYAVHLRGPLTQIPVIKSQVLQIIPVGKAFPLLRDNEATFRVLYEGRPVKGAQIKRDFVNDPDAKPIMTNSDGLFTINIRNQGLNVIAAVFDGPADNKKIIDKIEHLATLSFVLPHEPE